MVKKAERLIIETGLEPHFHITDAHYEMASDGTVQVSCFEEVRGQLKLLFTATVAPKNLVSMGKNAMLAASDAHNLSQWREDETSH